MQCSANQQTVGINKLNLQGFDQAAAAGKVGGTDSREGCRRTEIKTSFVGHWVMPPSQNIAVEGTEAQPLKSKTTLTSFTSTVRRYFATVGGMGDQETQVEDRVIASSAIMEAIGSVSRRGLSAWPQGTRRPQGTTIQSLRQVYRDRFPNYRREKSRVVFQAAEERNYHIFYQVGNRRMLLKMVTMMTRTILTMIPQHRPGRGLPPVRGRGKGQIVPDNAQVHFCNKYPQFNDHK